jgi:hypothetical protein
MLVQELVVSTGFWGARSWLSTRLFTAEDAEQQRIRRGTLFCLTVRPVLNFWSSV